MSWVAAWMISCPVRRPLRGFMVMIMRPRFSVALLPDTPMNDITPAMFLSCPMMAAACPCLRAISSKPTSLTGFREDE